jgi:tripartite-type tricarboxylate transporter receptor subunit TctC
MHTRNVSALLAVLAALAWGDAAQSQTWPQKPVRIVVPFAPGGNTDGIARLIAQPLGEAFGQQFLVENKPGAAGAIATEMVARSPGDGYTLLMGTPSQIAIVPQLTKTPYDPVKDLAPISVIGTNPYVLVVNARLPVQTLAEFIAHVRRQPDKVAYAAPVFGGLSHLSMIVFMKRAGLEMTPVSYKGGAGRSRTSSPVMCRSTSRLCRRRYRRRAAAPYDCWRYRANGVSPSFPTCRRSRSPASPASRCSPGTG